MGDKLKVVLVSAWYPVAISRYFEAAFRRRKDVELVTVGPYTGNWIPWNFGMDLPDSYKMKPDILIGSETQTPQKIALTYETEARLPWKPDLWVQVDGGFSFANKPSIGKNTIVGTDPHVINYSRQRALADTFYSMQGPYKSTGDLYLPYAHDPIWHGHYQNKEVDKYDVALIGLHYQERNELMGILEKQGRRCYYDLGPAYDDLNTIYHGTQIGLNWSSRQDLTARVFELAGMKRLAVVNRVPDLERFFTDGKDMIVFEGMGEAVEKINYYLSHKEESDKIANSGYVIAQKHTWDARVNQIINGVDYE